MSRARASLLQIARRLRETRLWLLLRPVYRSPPVYRIVGRLLENRLGFTAIVGEDPPRARDRGPAPVGDDAALRAAYAASPASQEPDTFVLYRIIGNDLVPRHRKGQSRDNVRFILEHEPHLPGCEKRWVLNRIVDPAEEIAVRRLLDHHHQPYFCIPFDPSEYQRVGWDLEGLPEPGYLSSRAFQALPADFRGRLCKRLYRHKNNYAVNNNGARNAALADGRRRAKWVLPWDGNCFVTSGAWQELTDAVRSRPWYPYVIVPMARVASTEALLEPEYRPAAHHEPQVLFRRDARERFDEEFYYSRRPKVELLWRLGVPGAWDQWAMEPWDLPYPAYAADAGAWQSAGWVARLPSGRPALESGAGSETRRLSARTEAVTAFLQRLDAYALQRGSNHQSALPSWGYGWVTGRTLTELRLACSRPARHERKRTRIRARRVVVRLASVGLNGMDAETVGQIYRWLRTDAAARALPRRDPGLGAWYLAICALCAAQLGHWEDLSLVLLRGSDHLNRHGGRRPAGPALGLLRRLCGETAL